MLALSLWRSAWIGAIGASPAILCLMAGVLFLLIGTYRCFVCGWNKCTKKKFRRNFTLLGCYLWFLLTMLFSLPLAIGVDVYAHSELFLHFLSGSCMSNYTHNLDATSALQILGLTAHCVNANDDRPMIRSICTCCICH